MHPRSTLAKIGLFALLAGACQEKQPAAQPPQTPEVVPSASVTVPPPPRLDRLARADFNRRAVERHLPLFWRSDANANGSIEPSELAVSWGLKASVSEFIAKDGTFSALFLRSYEALLAPPDDLTLAPEEERVRREAVRAELAQGRPTLIETDFSAGPPAERKLVSRLLVIAELVEGLYARQTGSSGLASKIQPGDVSSQALFHRNQGPFCVAPKTEQNPACFALPQRSERVVGLYPAAIQAEKGFCERLERQPNAKELMDHFAVVTQGSRPNTFKGVKYSQAYPEQVQGIASELEAAAKELDAGEAALKQYLLAAAASFRSDDWEPANEAWVAMSSQNSKYYLRVGPDEVYYEPCAWKAGFALTFARINPDSTAFRAMLEPLKQQLENEVAGLAGKPYRTRDVNFKLPDFIDIVVNSGDARAPLGGTKGQSLPNWGGVAKRGGRTVLMTNIATDADSQAQTRELMSSLFCRATLAKASTDPKVSLLSVVLHEAAHNLGPSHDYAVNGKVGEVAFGGGLAATLEELKAQTAALYFPRRLVEKQLITAETAERGFIQDVAWAFGHIAQGMYTATGEPRHYSQLASIQLGSLTQGGALVWKPEERAANGADPGCFELDASRVQPAVLALMQQVLEIKARGDRPRAEKLKTEWVDADNAWKKTRAVIAERWLRAPKASFVYAIRTD